jgi:hypothetical protein
MLATAPGTPPRDRIAIAGSIAIHLCVLAAALVVIPRASFPVDEPDERALLSSIVRVEHRAPPSKRHERQAPAEAVPRQQDALLPVIHAAVTVEHAARQLVVAAEHRAALPAAQVSARRRAVVREPAPVRVAVAKPAAAAAAAEATSEPVASPAPSPVVAQHEEGIGNFSETYPASVEPSARSVLLAGVNGVTVRITVDENGRATSIEFLRGPADAALRDELRTRLLAAHFIPAACNGLRCAGTLELRN